MICHDNIPYVSRSGRDLLLDARFLEDSGGAPRPAIVFVHGGGWIGGDKTTTSNDWLAGAGFFCVSIDYRLTDIAPFPAQIHDVKAAIRWVRKNAAQYNVDPDRIGVWGSSAGGHLAALCAVTNGDDWYDSDGNDGVSSAVQAAVPICPPTEFLIDWYAVDLIPIHETVVKCWHGLMGGPIANNLELAKLASPLWQIHAEAVPHLIVHGDADQAVPVSQARAYAAALKHAGAEVSMVEYPGEGHSVDDGIFTENPDPYDLRGRITAFFQKHLMVG